MHMRDIALKVLCNILSIWPWAYGLVGCGSGGGGLPQQEGVRGRPWWQAPGLGIMYQIEYRPGYDWERDYTEFNKTLMDAEGRIDFPGPFCNIAEWVALSEHTHADYHIFELKWHDGICYFNTALTDWKTDIDYGRLFADLSRAVPIPFMFYYSSVFDHNPQFDAIQPNPHSTMSYIGLERSGVYKEYLRGQFQEIMDQYTPDGMWMDWYMPMEGATAATVSFFKEYYPGTVLAFNAANLIPPAWGQLHYTSGEAHKLDGAWVKIVNLNGRTLPIFESCWKWATFNRRVLKHPWELVTPGGKWWQDPSLRDDPYDLVRMAAIVMANGGRLCVGVTSQMDGSIYPDQIRQLEILGDWYGPRKSIFNASVPISSVTEQPAGIRVNPPGFRILASNYVGDVLLHVINMDGSVGPVTIELTGEKWQGARQACLEPYRLELPLDKYSGITTITLGRDQTDSIDTLVRIHGL